MTKPGKMIRVEQSTVTAISIEPRTGHLTIEGVDQDKESRTLAVHTLRFGEGQRDVPDDVAEAIATLRGFAELEINDA